MSASSTQDHDAVLKEWMADEAALRARMKAEPGVARRDQVRGLTGLETMLALLNGELPPPPIAQTMDFTLVAASFGQAVFQGRPLFKHYNPLGSVHGGWFATLLDSALGCAVHTTMPVGRGYTTLELKVNLIRALTDKVPLVRAIGKVVHSGKQVATAEASIVGHDGKLYAHSSTTCLVFELPKA